MKNLSEVEAQVNSLAVKLGVSKHALPTYGRTEDGARPHIEVDSRGYHYVVIERGQELRRDTTRNLDELLYHVFEAVTFELACNYERSHRIAGQDFRRQLFARQIELLNSLSPAWAEREAIEHTQTLELHPFDDGDQNA